MNYKVTFSIGIVAGLLGVCIGAFGAHALKETLAATNRAETFELAVRYQFYHAFALIVTGILQRMSLSGNLPGFFFAGGILLFSGSLYILSLTGVTTWGAVTPIGGLLFIVGWASLLISVLRQSR